MVAGKVWQLSTNTHIKLQHITRQQLTPQNKRATRVSRCGVGSKADVSSVSPLSKTQLRIELQYTNI